MINHIYLSVFIKYSTNVLLEIFLNEEKSGLHRVVSETRNTVYKSMYITLQHIKRKSCSKGVVVILLSCFWSISTLGGWGHSRSLQSCFE